MTLLDENDAYLDCVNDEINTTSANGKTYFYYYCNDCKVQLLV